MSRNTIPTTMEEEQRWDDLAQEDGELTIWKKGIDPYTGERQL